MGDVDDLADVFGVVDRSRIKQIYERLDEPTPAAVAAVLDRAAELGKVPDRDYAAMAAERGAVADADEDVELLDLELDDPLDRPPEGDPSSSANAARGEQALRWAEENSIKKRAQRLRREGTIEQLVEFLATVDRWGNEALLSPDRASLPDSFSTAINTTMHGLQDALDELAANGDAAGLEAAREAVATIPNAELQSALEKETNALLGLLSGGGSGYNAARSWVLDEDLTPMEMAQRVDQVHHTYDLTLEQYQQLVEEATALLESVPAGEA